MDWSQLDHHVRVIDLLLHHDRQIVPLGHMINSQRFDEMVELLRRDCIVNVDATLCSFEDSDLSTRLEETPGPVLEVFRLSQRNPTLEAAVPARHPAPNSTKAFRWIRNVMEHLKGHPETWAVFHQWTGTNRAMDFLITTSVGTILADFWTGYVAALKYKRDCRERAHQEWLRQEEQLNEQVGRIHEMLS